MSGWDHVWLGVLISFALYGVWSVGRLVAADVRGFWKARQERRKYGEELLRARQLMRVVVIFMDGEPMEWVTDLTGANVRRHLPGIGGFGGRVVMGYRFELLVRKEAA